MIRRFFQDGNGKYWKVPRYAFSLKSLVCKDCFPPAVHDVQRVFVSFPALRSNISIVPVSQVLGVSQHPLLFLCFFSNAHPNRPAKFSSTFRTTRHLRRLYRGRCGTQRCSGARWCFGRWHSTRLDRGDGQARSAAGPCECRTLMDKILHQLILIFW